MYSIFLFCCICFVFCSVPRNYYYLLLFIKVFLSESSPNPTFPANFNMFLCDHFQGQQELESDKLELLKLALARNLARASQEEGILEWTNHNIRLLVFLDFWHVRYDRICQLEMDLSHWSWRRTTPKEQMFLWNCIGKRASQSCIMFSWNRWSDWLQETIHHSLDQSQIGLYYGCGKLNYATMYYSPKSGQTLLNTKPFILHVRLHCQVNNSEIKIVGQTLQICIWLTRKWNQRKPCLCK